MKRLQVLFYVLFVAVSLFFVLGQALIPEENTHDLGQASTFSANWERVYPDGKISSFFVAIDLIAAIFGDMTLMTRKAYDLALTAHLHHFSADETNETVIVSNGSLMGVDDYAQQLRLTSKPSQNLIICSENSVVDSIHRITLD